MVAAFLLTNKVWSPQFSLWLVPLAVLALPHRRILLAWMTIDALVWVPRMYFLYGNPNRSLPEQCFHHDGVAARHRGHGAVRAGDPADLPARRGSGALGRAGGRSGGRAFRPRARRPARLAAGLAASGRVAALRRRRGEPDAEADAETTAGASETA